MSLRRIPLATMLSVIALGSPLILGCTNPVATIYFNSGEAKYDQEDYQGALADYTKSIEINPNDAFAYVRRGEIYQTLENYQSAIAEYDKALDIDPQIAGAYINRGSAKNALNDYQGALDDFQKGFEFTSPTNLEAFDYLARGIAKNGLERLRRSNLGLHQSDRT